MFSRSAGKPVLIADVGDASVGVSLVTLGDGPAEVIRSLRATLSIENRTSDQTAAAITQLLEDSVTKLLAPQSGTKNETLHAVRVILRAPWTRFRTAHTEDSFPEPRLITKEMIAEEAKKALAAPSELDRNNILEAGVLQVFLNGYPTSNPLGKRAQSLGVVAFESDVDSAMKASILSVFGKLLPGRTPTIHSGLRALLIVMHEYFPQSHRFVLLDIGGATTSCAVIRKDGITQYTSVPEGLTTLLNRVAKGGLPEETLSLLRMLSTDACSTTACQNLKDSLAKAEPELVRTFGEAFATLANVRRLPNACMIAGPTELTPWLSGFFSRIDFSQFTATTKPLSLETLSPEHLLDAVHWGSGVFPDTGIGISAASVNILEQTA